MSDVRRCGWCGARLGARDWICFSCRNFVTVKVPNGTARPGPAARPEALRAALPGAGEPYLIGGDAKRIGAQALEPLEQVADVDIMVRDGLVEVPAGKGGRRTLLHDVLLHLAPASMTAVAGPSGAGKTTLLLLTGGGLGATACRLRRQGLGWSVGRG